LPKGTKFRPVMEYNSTRMKVLGVNERSFMKVLSEAAKECELKNIDSDSPISCRVPLESFLGIGGYYDMGGGKFFMVEVIITFSENSRIVNNVKLSWLLDVKGQPTVIDITAEASVNLQYSKVGLTWKLTWTAEKISLSFTRTDETTQGIWIMEGLVNGIYVAGVSFLGCVPFGVFQGTYYLKDCCQKGSENGACPSIAFNFVKNVFIITGNDGNKIYDFSYNPLKREFSFSSGIFSSSKLYFNAAAGNGLRLSVVPVIPGPTTVYFKRLHFTPGTGGNPVGDVDLASFAGYYPLTTTGSFVSIVGKTSGQSTIVTVGICVDGKNSSEFTSFNFEDNMLTFEPSFNGVSLNLVKTPTQHFSACAQVFVLLGSTKDPSVRQGKNNFFAPVPLSAFGPKVISTMTLHDTSPNNDGDYSLQIINVGSDTPVLKYYKGDAPIFDTTDATNCVYNSIEQVVTISDPPCSLNFTFNVDSGVTCAITTTAPVGLQVLSAFPPLFISNF